MLIAFRNMRSFLRSLVVTALFLAFTASGASAWGFFAHQRINRLAVFTLPPEMIPFFKRHIVYLTENSVNPDKRRYAVKEEAPRHYIDIDVYGDSAIYTMPRYWKDAVAKYTEDTLQAYGIVPWHINFMKYHLTEAMRKRDVDQILRLASDIGHYIADGNVPLHTTHNYNGQFTNQRGIHGLWESRLPELLSGEYDFFVGQASYIDQPQLEAWDAVTKAHLALDSVFGFEREVTNKLSVDRKYSYEERSNTTMKVYSQEFSKEYHKMLAGQVERHMRRSIQMVGDFWYTCWVDAGQPDLTSLVEGISEKELQRLKDEEQQYKKGTHKSREDEAFLYLDELKFGRSCFGHDHAEAKLEK